MEYIKAHCRGFLFPHVFGKFVNGSINPVVFGFFDKASFSPPETWVLIAFLQEIICVIALVVGGFTPKQPMAVAS